MRLTDQQMATYLSQHDLIWEVPALEWNTGIPLANGRIGAMIWGDGKPLKVTLDKYDCWELREQRADPALFNYRNLQRLIAAGDEEQTRHQMVDLWRAPDRPHPTRLPMPRLELDFGHCKGFAARLHLYGAQVSGDLHSENGDIHWRAFVHADLNLLVIDLHYDGAARLVTARCSLDHLSDEAKQTLRNWGYDPLEMGAEGGAHWLRLRLPAGGEYVVGWRRIPRGQDREQVAVAILTHHDCPDPRAGVLELLQRASDGGDALLREHEAWWRDYWRRSWLSLPDGRMEGLWWAEMYKLGCCSRPDSLPITLQGLWTADGVMPPWSGDYHLDMNVQESYWPVYAANRLELAQCLYDTFSACLPLWEERCGKFFGFDGLWSGCAIAPNGARIYGYHGVEFWPGNVAWLAHHYWLHWLYSRDEQFLREQALPIMRGALRTYQNLLQQGEDGRLHLPLGYSPEWGEGSGARYGPDPAGDIALIRFLCGALIEAAQVLGLPEAEVAGWRDTLQRLADYPQGTEGLWVTARDYLWESHRHHTHLMAIHPLGVLNIEQGEQARALIMRSIGWLVQMGTGKWTGWSFPWAALIAARVGQGNLAWDMLRRYTDAFIKPNTLHINGDPRRFGHSWATYEPMTLEAGFAFAAAIMEMLLQSWGGVLRLFPALPDRWHDAAFEDLRAEGAFLVSSRLHAGEVLYVRIASERGGLCRLRNPWGDTTVTVASSNATVRLGGETIEFATEPGAQYLLTREGYALSDADLVPPLKVRSAPHCHWFGVKRLARF